MKRRQDFNWVKFDDIVATCAAVGCGQLAPSPTTTLGTEVLVHLIAKRAAGGAMSGCKRGFSEIWSQWRYARKYPAVDLFYRNWVLLRGFSPFGGRKFREIRADIARELDRDFTEDGCLDCQKQARDALLDSVKQMQKCGLGDSRLADIDTFTAPGEGSWKGLHRTSSIAIVRKHGRIEVSCPMIYPAAVVVLKSLKRRHELDININCDSPHSPAQCSCFTNDEVPFFFSVDAPFFLATNFHAKPYKQMFVCSRKRQHLLVHHKSAHRRLDLCFFLKDSSAEAEYFKSFGRHTRVQGSDFCSSKDFQYLAQRLEQGTGLYAHDPIAVPLMRQFSLIDYPDRDPNFMRSVCMFGQQKLISSVDGRQFAESFAAAFIAEWNYCAGRPGWCHHLLLNDAAYLSKRSQISYTT